MDLLATLRPPTRDERAPAYRDRIPPPPEVLAKLVDARANALLSVEIETNEIRIFDKRTREQKDTRATTDDDETVDAAGTLIEALQLATGWYVFGKLADGFEPEGDCHACSIERFAWQDQDEPCPACGGAPDGDGPHMSDADAAAALTHAKTTSAETSENQAIAETLVDTLLQNEWIELVTAASRKSLVRDVIEFLVRHPECREPVGAAPVEDVVRAAPARTTRRSTDTDGDDFRAPTQRELDAMSPAARASALADVAARAPAAIRARAAREALAAAAPAGNPGFELLDYLTDLSYVAEVYADEDALAALLRGTSAPEA